MINKINCLTYCREFEKVENYEKAIADKEHTWICHHRLETHFSDGTERPNTISREEMIALDMYYDRPADELIFLTKAEHCKVHHNDKHLSHPGWKNGMYRKSANIGKKAYNNGKVVKYFKEGQEEAGFVPGILQCTKDKISRNHVKVKAHLGKRWYNNGEEENFFVEDTQPVGWIRGRTSKTRGDIQ